MKLIVLRIAIVQDIVKMKCGLFPRQMAMPVPIVQRIDIANQENVLTMNVFYLLVSVKKMEIEYVNGITTVKSAQKVRQMRDLDVEETINAEKENA